MQRTYISKLMELAQNDSKIMHILADSGTGYDEIFKRYFPNQVVNFGISEENMVAAAAGMSTVGKIPFVYTAGAFLAYRAFEFIRDDICLQNLNVKIVGMGSGLSWSQLGPTHHTTEDVGVLRALPNLVILSPATPKQLEQCVEYAYKHFGPVYIRSGMNENKEYYESDYKICEPKCDILQEGHDVTIISTGTILQEVMNVAQKLSEDGIKCNIVNLSFLKPCPLDSIKNVLINTKYLVTVEEHNVIGGLNSIISEYLVKNHIDTNLINIGLNDCFAKGYGNYEVVRKANKLDADSIYNVVKNIYSSR